VGNRGAWWVLDYASLVWPFVFPGTANWRDLLSQEWDVAFSERMDLPLRAITLDHVIDPCDVEEWKERVRERKEAGHQEALELYRKIWG
jgi:hypothetical protein